MEAASHLQREIQKYPADGGLYNLLGVIHAQHGKTAAAEENFRRALALDPKLTSAYLNLGRLQQDKDAPGAISTYRKLLSVTPANAEGRLQLAKLLEWQGEFREALVHLGRLPSAAALALRCGALAGLGRKAEAEQSARQLAQAADLSEESLLDIEPVLAKNGRDDLLRLLFEPLQARRQLTASGLSVLGTAYERLGLLAQARETLETAAEGDRDNPQHPVDLARVAYQQRDLKGSLGYLARARDLRPTDPSIYYSFGAICNELQLSAEAKNWLSKAVDLAPSNPAYVYALAAVLTFQARNAADAIPSIRSYRQLQPADARGPFLLGVASFRTADYDEARRQFEPLTRDAALSGGADYYLGRIAKRLGDLEQAGRRLASAAAKADQNPDVHAELGHVRLQQGDLEAARREIARALTLDSKNRLANQYLVALYQRTRDARLEQQKSVLAEIEKQTEQDQLLQLRSLEIRPYSR